MRPLEVDKGRRKSMWVVFHDSPWVLFMELDIITLRDLTIFEVIGI
jgi:hypothetical protein